MIPKPPTKQSPLRSVRMKTWEEALKLGGFPQPVVVIDFESFFSTDYTLKKMSTIEHIMDDQFETLGVGIKINGQPSYFYAGENDTEDAIRFLQREYGQNLERCTVASHSKYDMAILRWRYSILPKNIIDIHALAQHWDARAKNSVEELGKRLGLKPKGDTLKFKEWTTRNRYKKKGGRGKQRLMPVKLPKITPPMWEELKAYTIDDVDIEWDIFKWLLPRVSRPEIELHAMNHTTHLYIDPVIMVDYEEAKILAEEMEHEIDRVVEHVGHTRTEISGENSFEALMTVALTAAGDDVDGYLKPAKNKRGYKLAIAKKDKVKLERLLFHKDKTVRELMAAKQAISSWPNHIKRIHNIVAQCKASGGRLPVPLVYFGAHTGRWSGGERINLQNLGSRGHKLVNRIRTLLLAPPGWEFVIADAASIESRVLAWLSDQTDKMEKFLAGEEMYCRFAEVVMNLPAGSTRKPVPEKDWKAKGCIPAIEKRMKWLRNSIGKIGDLACGYGGGENAIAGFQPDLPLALRVRIKEKYREMNPKIEKYWHKVGKKFLYTAKFGKPCNLPHGISFRQTEDVDVIITLPSGREIKYHKVQVGQDKYGRDQAKVFNPKERKWEYIWGGTLVENIVQAVARDILWEAILKVEAAGYRVVHHVHDELIALVLAGLGVKALAVAIAALRHRPSWAKTCPLDGEGVVTQRYGGH